MQEVPGEISLCFSICGCALKCEGCHAPYLWKNDGGSLLSKKLYNEWLQKYKGFATCVLFMGGEWHEKELVDMLKTAKRMGYKTCLYTGEETLSSAIVNELDWIKTGKWDASLGGLKSKTTNQKFIEIKSNKILNHLFIKN